MEALIAVGVLLLGGFAGYGYRKREHLRELRVERYAELLDATNEASSFLADYARQSIDSGATHFTTEQFSAVDSAMAKFSTATTRANLVSSARVLPLTVALYEAVDAQCELVTTKPPPSWDDVLDRNTDVITAHGDFRLQAAHELCGVQVPSPKKARRILGPDDSINT